MDRQLIEYLPEWLRGFREVKLLCDAQQSQAEKLCDAIESVYNNNFAEDLDSDGCSHWERLLGIKNKDSYSVEERRAVIGSRLVEQRPFTMRSLEKTLQVLCGENGYLIQLDNYNYTMNVLVALTSKNTYEDVKNLLGRMIPANMLCDVSLMYNTYDFLEAKTYDELKSYSYGQLREEVI